MSVEERIAAALERIAKVMEQEAGPLAQPDLAVGPGVTDPTPTLPRIEIPENAKVDVGHASPAEVAKDEQKKADRDRATSADLVKARALLEAKPEGAVLTPLRDRLVAAGLDQDLAARLAAAGDTTMDPPLAKSVRAAALARLGEAGLNTARDKAGIVAGVCPTGAQLRTIVLTFMAAAPAPVAAKASDPWS